MGRRLAGDEEVANETGGENGGGKGKEKFEKVETASEKK